MFFRTALTVIITSLLASSAAYADGNSKWPFKKRFSTKLVPYKAKRYPDLGLKDVITKKHRQVRGFYLTPYFLYRVGVEESARRMKKAHMNAVLIDVKDDWGQVLWPSKVPLSKDVQRHLIRDPKKLVAAFHKLGIYVIARIVCFKDSRLGPVRPDLGVRSGRVARRLFYAGAGWLDHYSLEVQDYLIDLALEWESFGADEIQLDYIRFPTGRNARWGKWLHKDKRNHAEVIAGFLDRADRALKTPISIDVFGLTTLVEGDARKLGQPIEILSKYAEVLSPMMYANGMQTYFKNNKVTNGVYSLIQCGLWRARHKIGKDVILRPLLQAYPDGVRHMFGREFIKKQLEAARKAGSEGFLFWNSTMKNGVAFGALRSMGVKKLDAIGADREIHKRPENKPRARWCRQRGTLFKKKKKKTAPEPKKSPPPKKGATK